VTNVKKMSQYNGPICDESEKTSKSMSLVSNMLIRDENIMNVTYNICL
jgi:hypothetical protein